MIREWIKDIWDLYVLDDKSTGMSGAEFEYFFKSSFRIVKARFDLLFENKDVVQLSFKRFKLKHGRITQ